MQILHPSLESQFWAYKENNQNIDNAFNTLNIVRQRISRGERIDSAMLKNVMVPNKQMTWALEGQYMGQSPKKAMAIAMEEITNVEMGLVAAATIGVLMVLSKIWSYITKFFNKLFNKDTGMSFGSSSSTGDKAASIVENEKEVTKATEEVTHEVKKATVDVKAETSDFEHISYELLQYTSKEASGHITNIVAAHVSNMQHADKADDSCDKLEALLEHLYKQPADQQLPIDQSPQYKAYIESFAQYNESKDKLNKEYTALKAVSNVDKLVHDIVQAPAQAFQHMKDNEAKLIPLGIRCLTPENIKALQEIKEKLEERANDVKKKTEDKSIQLSPENAKLVSQFYKDYVQHLHGLSQTLTIVANLTANNTKALSTLTKAILKVVKAKDAPNEELIQTLNDAITTYQEKAGC